MRTLTAGGRQPTTQQGELGGLREVAARGVGILMVEHALDVVAALCQRVIVMASGSIIAEGTYQEIAENTDVRRAYLS